MIYQLLDFQIAASVTDFRRFVCPLPEVLQRLRPIHLPLLAHFDQIIQTFLLLRIPAIARDFIVEMKSKSL